MSTHSGTHPEGLALTGFLIIDGGGAYPKKYSGAKKLLRLSPPHRFQSLEVPFAQTGKGKSKSHAQSEWVRGFEILLQRLY
jgi:hypothetical protein